MAKAKQVRQAGEVVEAKYAYSDGLEAEIKDLGGPLWDEDHTAPVVMGIVGAEHCVYEDAAKLLIAIWQAAGCQHDNGRLPDTVDFPFKGTPCNQLWLDWAAVRLAEQMIRAENMQRDMGRAYDALLKSSMVLPPVVDCLKSIHKYMNIAVTRVWVDFMMDAGAGILSGMWGYQYGRLSGKNKETGKEEEVPYLRMVDGGAYVQIMKREDKITFKRDGLLLDELFVYPACAKAWREVADKEHALA